MAPGFIKVLKPTGKGKTSKGELARRTNDLNGKVIGFLDNGKPNCAIFLSRIEELLSQKFKFAGILHARKGGVAGAGALPANQMEEFAAKCDAVINGMCD